MPNTTCSPRASQRTAPARLPARSVVHLAALALAALALAACGQSALTPTDGGTADGPTGDVATTGDTGGGVVARCVYTNQFSMSEECRDYTGAGWAEGSVTVDCNTRGGALTVGSHCEYAATLGTCTLAEGRANMVAIAFPGADPAQCATAQRGCEVFGGGRFSPQGVCTTALGDGGVPGDGSSTGGLAVFQPPVRECRAPLAGEPAGHSAGGQVCTWSAISGSTEEGRHFEDYASCERVRTQRPYYPAAPAPARETPDPRLADPAYVSELSWVRSQVESSACVCCHSSRVAPRGASNWYVEAPGNWMDSFGAAGLALGAGWIDSRALGAYPADQNNGFARTTSGIPSTDPERMARFFRNELANRGLSQSTFARATPFGGPIYDQLVYQPTACTRGEGVAADGTVRWSGGGARYVYVLAAGSANPGVPPNLDLPAGTLWRLDVPFTGSPIESGITYGQTPSGLTQRFPEAGAAQALASGTQYYLYVLADVGIPITRCLFTYTR